MSRLRIDGMLDPHVHLRGLQWSHKGTFASETAAAVAGGYWAVLDMPNTLPSTVNATALAHKRNEISRQAVSDWGVYFGATGQDNTAAFSSVVDQVCGLKIYNNATTGDLLVDDQTVRDQIYNVWPASKPIAVHAEGPTILAILDLVRRHRKQTHFCHVSSAEEIGYLWAAKEEGLAVTVGVCPHHLFLTRDDLSALGPFGLMKPELKTAADQDALWEALDAGVVDVIESDHAPHTIAEKQAAAPPYGVPGLETTLPLLGLAVHQGRLDAGQIPFLVAEKPRKIFGLQAPPETYTILDLDVPDIIDRQNLHTHCGWSPFEGMQVFGKVREVWIRGQQVFDGEAVLVEPGYGRNVVT